MRIRPWSLASGALIAAIPAMAQAQSALPSSQAGAGSSKADIDPARDDAGVNDIIVTANRRSENLQNVPISIVAFKGETLTKLGIQSTNDLPQITAGLSQARTLVGVNAFLRGVGTTSAGYSTEVPIATYLDGLYLPNSASSAFSFNNIERIEVLKGPQGTLYGRNTTGGLIHVITRDPGSELAVDASASYANYQTTQFNFYGSVPISETLAANVAVVYINQADGWGRNLYTGSDVYKFKDFGIQGKLQWRPSADTTVTLRGFYDNVKTDQGNGQYIFPGSVGADGSVFRGKFLINERIDPSAKQRQYNVSLKIEQRFGFATLTSTTGYIDNRSPSLSVQSGNFGNLVAGQGAVFLGGLQTAKTFSQELQLASLDSDSKFSWIIGGFYYRDRTEIISDVYGVCVGTVCVAPVPTRTDGIQRTKSYSGYADGTYEITPTTKVTLGLRYTSDNKTLDGLLTPLAGRPNSIPVLPSTTVTRPGQPFTGFPNGIDTDVTFGKVTYRAVLSQELASEVNLYASYNRGFKSGGFNPISFTNPASRPEVLDAFEIGFKSRTANHVLQVNASAFYYDYKDIQLRTTAPPAPPGGSLLYNAARAHIKGVDLDIVLAPAKGLTFTLAAELLDAKYSEFPGGICTTPRVVTGTVLGGFTSAVCDLSGRQLPNAPKFSYVLGVNYEVDTNIGRLEFNASDGFKSHYFWEPENRLRQDAFHVVSAAVTWTPTNSRFSFQAFGRNLLNEYYLAGAGAGTGGNDVAGPAAPRTYGIKARYKF
ncbi:TonB-dependent receptor [Sphingomonas sp. QA11]|uniref:TonB-dependent receptor n=1 Tax=Sphingomonas sp. QA11 TaxID=2950605 RepID=UPI00234A07B7|nr:TonB-dependent receptor [Sphingomonas sp. QA11]WCM25007.1 TonB-dependent receptor [Sphingomonas sp. QA11]